MKIRPSVFRLALAAITAVFFSSAVPLWAGTYTWNNTGGGNWNVAGNWTPSGVPGSADTALINAAGTYVVTVTDTESAASLTVGVGSGAGVQTLQVNNGGVLNQAGSTLNTTGSLTVETGGVLNASATIYLYGPLTNAGTINLTNLSIGVYNNNGVPNAGGIDNQGTINFYGGFGDHINTGNGGYEYMINQGTVNEKSGAGISSISVYIGSLAGIYNAAVGTTLQFVGGSSAASPQSVGIPPVLNGPGQYQFTGGYLLLTVDMIPGLALTGGTLALGPAFQEGGAITNLTLDGITLPAGTYQVNGTLTVTNSALDGAITVNSGGVLDESGATLATTGSLTVGAGGVLNVASTLILYGPLANSGTINLTNASIGLYNNNSAPNAGGIDNQGTINFYGGFGDHINSANEGYEYMNNLGTVNEKAGAGTSSITAAIGVLEGTYNAAAGTLVQFSGGPSLANPLSVGVPPVLNGPGQYQFTGGYLLLTVDMIPGLALTAIGGAVLELGPAFQDGGAITNLTLDGITLSPGTYQVNGTLTVTNSTIGGAITVNSGGVLDESAATLATTGSLTVGAGGVLNVASSLVLYGPLANSGTINLTNASIGLYNNNSAPNAGGIDNQGTINFYGGFGDHINSANEGYEYMNNLGTVNEKAGAGTSSITAAIGVLEGTYNAAAGTLVQFSGGPSLANPLSVGVPPVLNGPGQYQFTGGYLLLTVDMIPGLALTAIGGAVLELGPAFQDGGAITNLTLDGITLSPGTYQVNGTLTVTNSTIGGAITVNSGGVLDESAATLATTGSLTVGAGGVLNVASSLVLYGPLANSGTMNLTNASIGLYNNNSAPNAGGIDNQGTINFYGGFGDHINSANEGYEYMNNLGTVNEKAGAGTSSITAAIGVLEGTYNAAAGTLVQFSGGPSLANPLSVGVPPVLNGPGQYQFTGGYLQLTVDTIPGLALTAVGGAVLELGPAFQDGGAITNLTLDGITLSAGTYQVNGTLTVTNSTIDGAITVNSGGVLDESAATLATTGSLTVGAGGVLNVASALTLFGPLANSGTINLTNASIGLYNNNSAPNAGGIDNQGTINFYGGLGDHINAANEGYEYMNNEGTVNEETGAGTSSIGADIGVLEGIYNAAAGTLVQFSGGTSVANPLSVGVPPVLNGPGQYQFTGGYLLLTVDTIPGLALTAIGGAVLELGPAFQAGGAITNLTLDGITISPGTYQVNGKLTVTNSTIDGAITVNSGGVLDESGATLATTGSLTVGAGGVLNVASTLTLFGPLANSGTINLTNASITLYNNNDAPNAGGIANQGEINFYGASGDHINSANEGYEYMNNQGTLTQRPGTGNSSVSVTLFTDPGTVDSQEALLTLSSLPLQSSSVLNFGLNGATDSGKIAVTANVVLNGTVSANLNDGYVPAKGAEFNVLSSSSSFLLSGTFANTNLPAAAPGQCVYGASVFSLLFSGTGGSTNRPVLTIARVTATTVDVSWPTAAGNFNLQTRASLSSGSWMDVGSGINTVGSNFVLTATLPSGPAFFRLQSQ